MDTKSQELLLHPLAAFLKAEASSTPPLSLAPRDKEARGKGGAGRDGKEGSSL